jgi:hypothetical protein
MGSAMSPVLNSVSMKQPHKCCIVYDSLAARELVVMRESLCAVHLVHICLSMRILKSVRSILVSVCNFEVISVLAWVSMQLCISSIHTFVSMLL